MAQHRWIASEACRWAARRAEGKGPPPRDRICANHHRTHQLTELGFWSLEKWGKWGRWGKWEENGRKMGRDTHFSQSQFPIFLGVEEFPV